MTGTITRTPCPQCKQIGGLNVDTKFFAKPIGEYSLAGFQMKITGQFLPVLQCDHCDLNLVGRFNGEHHVVFDPPQEERIDGAHGTPVQQS